MTKLEQKMETRKKVKLSSLQRLIAQSVMLKVVSNKRRFSERYGLYIQNPDMVFLKFKKIFGGDY